MEMIRDISGIEDEDGYLTLVGEVTNVFHSDIDFTAGEFTPDDSREPLRFSGEAILGRGDRVEMTGKWFNNPRFGRQFIVEDFTRL